MSCFPLYESLFDNSSEKDLAPEQKEESVSIIKELDQKGHEYLYIIIKMYANNNREGDYKTYMLPYTGNYLGLNIQFDLENFPKKLKQMLYKFVKTHKRSMDESAKIIKEAEILTQGMTDINGLLV